MRNHTVRTAFAALAVLMLPALAHGQQPGDDGQPTQFPPVAYVNTQQVVTQAPGATEAQEAFQEELKKYQAEVRQMQTTLDSLRQAYQQQEATLTEEARQKRQEEIRQKQQELQQRAQALEEKVGTRQQELLAPILERVQGVIEEIRNERGYALVFDVSGPGVVAADPSLNITQDVLDRLEQRAVNDTASTSGGTGR